MHLSFDPNCPRDTADMFNHLRAMGKIDEAVQVHVSDVIPATAVAPVPVSTVPVPVAPLGAPTPGVSPTQALAAIMPADAVELDTNGMPWNEAYHSSGRTKTAKNVWKARSGKGPEAKAALAAHIASQAGGAAVPLVPAPVAEVPVAPATAPVAEVPVAPAAPVAPVPVAPAAVAPVAPAGLPGALPAAVAPVAPAPTYDDFVARFVGMMEPNIASGEPAIIQDAQAVYDALGITTETMPNLQTDPALLARAYAYLEQLAA